MILEVIKTEVHVVLLASNCGIPVNACSPDGNGDAELPCVVLCKGGEPGSRHGQ